jgi:hypothetical protein
VFNVLNSRSDKRLVEIGLEVSLIKSYLEHVMATLTDIKNASEALSASVQAAITLIQNEHLDPVAAQAIVDKLVTDKTNLDAAVAAATPPPAPPA